MTIIFTALLITFTRAETTPEKIIKLFDKNAVIEKAVSGENLTVYHHNGKGKYKTILFPEVKTTLLRSFEKPKK